MSLSNTIPFKGNLVTIEGDINKDGQIDILDKKISDVLADVSKKRKTDFHQASPDKIPSGYMDRFSYLEHSDNVAMALKVCELSGIDRQIALDGMLSAQPDPGATIIWELNCHGSKNYFVNLLAANDPSSTYNVYKHLLPRIGDSPVCIFLNTREDRRYRTNQLLNLVFTKIKPNFLIVRGEKLPAQFHDYQQVNPEIKTHQIPNNVGVKDLISEFSSMEDHFIVGIGNMVGWGEKFVQDLKEYRG